MQFSMHRSVQYDSAKGEIEVALYAALEGVPKISFYGAFKTAWKVDDPLVSSIESAPEGPEGTLKLHLKMHLAIYIMTHKKVHLRFYF